MSLIKIKIINSLDRKINDVSVLLFFLLTLTIRYSFAWYLFGDFYAIIHDNLDSELIYNKVIGDFVNHHFDFNQFSQLLGGVTPWYYYPRTLQPLTWLYGLMPTKAAYFIIEIIVQAVAYYSFLYLLKKYKDTKENNFSDLLFAIGFSTSLTYPLFGLGLAIFPYLLALCLNKDEKLNAKQYSILFFSGLNTTLMLHTLFAPLALIFCLFLCRSKISNKNIIKVIFVFFLGCIISSIGLIYAQLFTEPTHRTLWNEIIKIPSSKELIIGLIYLFERMDSFYHSLATPYILTLPVILLGLLTLNKRFIISSICIIFFVTVVFLLREFYSSITPHLGPLKSVNFYRVGFFISIIVPLAGYLIYWHTKNNYIKLGILFFSFCSFINSLLFQIGFYENLEKHAQLHFNQEKLNHFYELRTQHSYLKMISEVIPSLLNTPIDQRRSESQNFSSYFNVSSYACIKGIVQFSRVMSVIEDPMKAVYSDINVIDGYHNIYPASYKSKFEKIIAKEIENTTDYDYFYRWGSRAYIFFHPENGDQLNYNAAKQLGAEYVISKLPLDNIKLINIIPSCSIKPYFLYKIN